MTTAWSETDLVRLFLQRVSEALPDVRVFRRNVVAAKTATGQWVRAGIPGQADMYAITRGGLHVELEAKAAIGKLAPAQRRWRDWCQQWQIPYRILRAMPRETPAATVERWVEILKGAVECTTTANS